MGWLLAATPFEWSLRAGQIVAAAGCLVGIVLIALLMRRPSVNKPSCVALLLVLSGTAVLFGANLWFELLPQERILGGAFTVLGFLLLPVGFAIAIWGLVDFALQRDRFDRGPGPAISALLLAMLVGFVSLVRLSFAFYEGRQFADELRPPPATLGKWVDFQELNFRYHLPGSAWQQVNPRTLNSDAAIAFMRARPQMVFMLIAEEEASAVEWSSEQLAEIAKVNLRNSATSVKVMEEFPRTIAGRAGVHIATEAMVQGRRQRYIHWIHSQNGYLYQLVALTEHGTFDELNREANSLFANFELIAPERVADRLAGTRVTDFESTKFGYQAALRHSGWYTNLELARAIPQAELAVSWGSSASCIVVPVYLYGEDPPLDSLTRVLAGHIGITYPHASVRHVERIESGPETFQQLALTQPIDGQDFDYLLRVEKRQGFAYLIAAWSDTESPTAAEHVQQILQRITYDREIAPPRVLTPDEQLRHALCFNEWGIQLYNGRQLREALACFRRAFEFRHDDLAMFTNAVDAYIELGEHTEALAYLDAHQPKFRTEQTLNVRRAAIQAELGQHDDALATYKLICQNGKADEQTVSSYAALLVKLGQTDEALGLVERQLRSKPSLSLEVLRASLHRELGEYDEAIQLLEKQLAGTVLNSEVAFELVEVYHEAERYQQEHELAQRLLRNGQASPYIHYLLGRSAVGLKWYPEAKESFETAHRLEPANPQIKEYLDFVSAMLGEGDNVSVKQPIEAVEIPAELLELASATDAETRFAAHGAYYRRRIMAYEFEPGVSYKTTRDYVVRILDQKGASHFSTFQVDFDPLSEEVFVNELTVRNAAGEVVSEGDVARYYVTGAAEGEIVSQRKVLHVPVAGLQPGFEIHYRATIRDRSQPTEFPFVNTLMSSDKPIVRSVLFVRAPEDQLVYHASNEDEPKRGEGTLSWTLTEPPLLRAEPYAVSYEEYLPTVRLAAAETTWEEVGAEYLESIADRLQPDATLGALAATLVSNTPTADDRVVELARYVQRECRYRGIEFGRRARIPEMAATVLKNRYGDCKDHALLLWQLLRGLDIEAHLALVRVGLPLDERLASLDQFDHMIVYVEDGDGGGRFVDVTDKHTDPAVVVPSHLAEKDILVLRPEGASLMHSGNVVPAGESFDVVRELHLSETGELVVDEQLSFRGNYSSAVRSYLQIVGEADRANLVQPVVASSGGVAQVEKIEVENLTEAVDPLVVRLRYKLDGKFSPLADDLVGSLPAGWEVDFLEAAHVEPRSTPFRIRSPQHVHSQTVLHLPKGYAAQQVDRLEREVANDFVTWQLTAAGAPEQVQWNFDAQTATGVHAAERYKDYRQAMQESVSAIGQNILIARP